MITKPLSKIANQEDLDHYNQLAEMITSALKTEENPTVLRMATKHLSEINEAIQTYRAGQ